MQQFTVPQFIDVEDKILGPIAVRQFIIILAGAGVIFLNYELFARVSFLYFLVSSLFLFILTVAFAFFKVNGRPFHLFLLNFFSTIKDPKYRVWNKKLSRDRYAAELPEIGTQPMPHKAPLTASKLAQLSLVVDTGGAFSEGEVLPSEEITATR